MMNFSNNNFGWNDEEDADYDADDIFNNMPPPRRNFRNDLYSNAYGDYRGGYGPGGGFGPPRFFGPGPGPFMPPPPGPLCPPGPLGPPGPCWGRGFGPAGPPMRRFNPEVIKYLMRCGVAKENLKNLPRDLLNLFEPEHCGLCNQSFDSFSMSRLHYISKNHLKNQKKWLVQQSDMGMFRSGAREAPLKSRDLYCELCDVQITSKVHAESHYSGKPHRAIVDGRRNPKNPMLLQRGMKDRLDQLVRRELKHLKPAEEPVIKEKEVKPVQPDLYCEICKTSMTCTEQMTMHLNGKRHLAKEKQHILKMMKGETVEDKNEETGEDEHPNTSEEQTVEADASAAGEEDACDWGNGNQSWDEPSDAVPVSGQ